jgi:UDP-N-acetylglucosamine 3-dehydrogenase
MSARVLVVGVGVMGTNHVRVLADMDSVDRVGVADRDTNAVARMIRGRRMQGYADWREAMAEERPDAVVVAVPTRWHCEVASYALERGIHVLVEKPITSTLDEGEALVDLATRSGALLAVGHVERFNPGVVELKRRLDAGQLGRVFHVHARRLGPFPPRVADVGVTIDLGTHDLDVLHLLMGCVPDVVASQVARRAESAHEQLVCALLRFPSGTIGQIEASWLTPRKTRELTVTGEHGVFHLDYLRQELRLYQSTAARPDGTDAVETSGASQGILTQYAIDHREPLRGELEAFVSAVLRGGPPPFPARDALAAIRLAQQIVAVASASDAVPVAAE